MATKVRKFRVYYSCGHDGTYRAPGPRVGDWVLCVYCDGYRIVTVSREGANGQHSWKCRNCPSGRSYGQAKVNRDLGAVRHRRKRPGHVVDLFHGSRLEHTYGNDSQMTIEDLAKDLEKPPF